MRTITSKTTRVIRTIVASLLILVALSGVSKGVNSGKELAINNNELLLQMKSWIGNNTTWSDFENLKTEEFQNDSAEVQSDGNSQFEELTSEMESWINSDTFWSNEKGNEEQELGSEMKSWINNKSGWSNDEENKDSELTLQLKSWISHSHFWSADTENSERELASQIRIRIRGNSFMNEAEDQISAGNELANN